MNIQVTDTIDTIVNTNLKAVKVLSRYGIDFCSDGSRSLKEACHEANVRSGNFCAISGKPKNTGLVHLLIFPP